MRGRFLRFFALAAIIAALALPASAKVFEVNIAEPDFGSARGIRYYPLNQNTFVPMKDILYEPYDEYTYRILELHHGSSCGNCRLRISSIAGNKDLNNADDIKVIIAAEGGSENGTHGYRTGFLQLTPGSIAYTGVWLASEDLATNAAGFELWENSLIVCGAVGDNLSSYFKNVQFNNSGTFPNGMYVFKGHRLVGGSAGTQSLHAGEYVNLINSLRPNADNNTVKMESTRGTAGVAIPFTAEGAKDSTHNPSNPIEGDEKYVPIMWYVTDVTGAEVSSGDVYSDKGMYKGNAYVNAAGDFTLHVKFRINAYINGRWILTSSRHISEVTRDFSLTNSGSNIVAVRKTHTARDSVVQEYQHPTKPRVTTTFDKVLEQSKKKYQLVVLHKMGCSHCANSITAINTYDHLFKNKDDLDIILYGFGANDSGNDETYMKEVNEHFWPGQNVNGTWVTRDPSPRDWNGWNNVLYAREPSKNNQSVFSSYAYGIGVHRNNMNGFDTPLVFIIKDGVIRGYATGGIAAGSTTDAVFEITAKKWYSFINDLRAEDSIVPNDDVSKPVQAPQKPVITVPDPEPAPDYSKRIDGGNVRTWSPGGGDLVVTVNMAPYSEEDMFQGVMRIDENNEFGFVNIAYTTDYIANVYEVEYDESNPDKYYNDLAALTTTVVTLKANYLDTLPDGDHWIMIAYADGNAFFKITKSGGDAVTQVKLTTEVNDSRVGRISAGGSRDKGSSVTVTATPNTGYYLSKWVVNNEDADKIAGSNSYVFTINKNTTVRAVFAKMLNVSTSVSNTSAGTISGSGYYEPNATAEITVTPKSGYAIASLTVGGSEVMAAHGKTSAYEHRFTVKKDTAVRAAFAKAVNVTVGVNNSNLGSVSPSGSVMTYTGDILTLTATPKTGYHADSWTVGSKSEKGTSSTDGKNVYSFTVTDSVTVTVNFAEGKEECDDCTLPDLGGGITTPGGDSIDDDCDDCTLPDLGGTPSPSPSQAPSGGQTIIENGADRTWNGSGPLAILLSVPSARFGTLKGADGAELIRMKDFMLASGAANSSVITFTEQYLASLPNGDNVVTITLDDGRTAEVKINVTKGGASPTASPTPGEATPGGSETPSHTPDGGYSEQTSPPPSAPGANGYLEDGSTLNADHEISFYHAVKLKGSSVVQKGRSQNVSFTVNSVKLLGDDRAMMIDSRGRLSGVNNLMLVVRKGTDIYCKHLLLLGRSASSTGSVASISADSSDNLDVSLPIDWLPDGDVLMQFSGTRTDDITRDIRTDSVSITVRPASAATQTPGGGYGGDSTGGGSASGSSSGGGGSGCDSGAGSAALLSLLALLGLMRRKR